MRKSGWTPSIVPNGDDQNVYLMVDNLGRFGRVWREAEVDHPDLETVIHDLLAGEYSNPIQRIGRLVARRLGRCCPGTAPVSSTPIRKTPIGASGIWCAIGEGQMLHLYRRTLPPVGAQRTKHRLVPTFLPHIRELTRV